MRAMCCFKKKYHYGYTIIETMIVIVISSIMIAALYQMFYSQQENYMSHNESYNMNQNLRSAAYLLTKEIRLAGYNPTKKSPLPVGYDPITMSIPIFGFTKNFKPNIFADIGLSDIDYVNDKTRIAFSVDKNSDKCIDADNAKALLIAPCNTETKDPNALKEDGERGEQISYRLNENNLQRFNSEIYSSTNNLEMSWQVIATNIDALNFVFLDENSNPINNPLNNTKDIKSIEISILARTEKKDYKYKNAKVYRNKQGDNLCPTCRDDHYHRQLISTTIRLRNLS